jgi:hypothetical protein
MGKVCSLDFLNKSEFDTDICSVGGRKIFSKGDKITPEILACLYFMNVASKTPAEAANAPMPAVATAAVTADVAASDAAVAEVAVEEAIVDTVAEVVVEEVETETLAEYESHGIRGEATANNSSAEISDNLVFDEEYANKVADIAYKVGAVIGLSESNLEELKEAAYNYKIGVIKFKEKDLSDPNFDMKVADAGYAYLIKEKKIPDKIAGVAKRYMETYDCIEFFKNSTSVADIPFSHIVGVIDYYFKLVNKAALTKEEALKRVLKVGGYRFNIFVLHKFINVMRETNE